MQETTLNQQERAHRIRLILFGGITLAIMVFIFVMSARDAESSSRLSKGFLSTLIGTLLGRFLPQLSEKGVEYDIRKYAHMFEYCCLSVSSFLFFRELYRNRARRGLSAAASALALCILYACSDEWHQTFVAGRSGRASDVLVDTIGSLIGLAAAGLLFLLYQRRQNKKKRVS